MKGPKSLRSSPRRCADGGAGPRGNRRRYLAISTTASAGTCCSPRSPPPCWRACRSPRSSASSPGATWPSSAGLPRCAPHGSPMLMLDVNAALTSPWTVRLVVLGTIAVLRRVPPVPAPRGVPGHRPRRRVAAVCRDAGYRPDAAGRHPDPRTLAGLLAAVPARRRPGPGAGGRSLHARAAGRWRNRGKWAAAIIVAALCAARLYLAVDHPTDQLTALIIGVAARRRGVPAGGPQRRLSHLLPGRAQGASRHRRPPRSGDRHRPGPSARSRRSPAWNRSAWQRRPARRRCALRSAVPTAPRPRCSASSTRSATSGPTAGTSWSGPSSTGGSKTRSRSPPCAGWSSTRITCCA